MSWTLCAMILLGQESDVASRLRPLLERHCVDCHGAGDPFRLDTLGSELGRPETAAAWTKVFDRVAAGEMPPRKKPRPPERDVAALLDALRPELTRAALARRDGQGRAAYRRLNRAEYENTLRDLLDLPHLSIQALLPEDGRAGGFTKVGGALDLSHVQLARYMDVAELALDAATAARAEPPAPAKVRFSVPANFGDKFWENDAILLKGRTWDRDYVQPPKGPGDYDHQQERLASHPGPVGVFRPEFYKFPYRFWTGYRKTWPAPAPGFYRLRLSLWSFLFDKGEIRPAPKPEVALLRAGPRAVRYVDAPSFEPKVHEVELWLEKGELPGFSAHSLVFDRPHGGASGLVKQTKPGIAIDWAELEGPLARPWPPEGHRRLFGTLPIVPSGKDWTVASKDPAADARRLLPPFLKRAFRRAVPEAEVERYLAVVRRRLDAKDTFERAMKAAYKAALCSPDFLFLRETPGPLDAWALASRLSYFLWNSAPDDALLDLAEKGALKGDGLRRQVERMLADPRSERFVEDFTDQWLELRDIDATCPDTQLYPEFNPYLKDAMLGESRAFFRELLRADAGAAEIVRSDWAMLNQAMAEFYGIPKVHGPAFRRVTLPPGTRRGGVLTQAAVLKVTANGTVTSPVERGAWVLDRILNRPPDPPPPDIPAVEPDLRGATTIRDQLAKHRSQPVCATCHSHIDPLGMALESFDVMGGWRARYRSLGAGDPASAVGLKGRPVDFRWGRPVDPSGQLADGSAYKDVDDFKRLLARDPERLARAIAEKLIVYATGAEPDFADRGAVDDLLRRVRGTGYGLRSIVREIVAGPLFQSK